ncbi:class GN sortase [Pelagibius sp.]|uniref:class GN sortase n=1 Tax=Pelagibius sp. TaxID=1931238 RepID=UPI002627EBC8|nr:class GN sortase [Pelagibius sp.]
MLSASKARQAFFGLALLLVGLGLWQLSGAALIHGKAWLAQHLMERAWTQTLAGADTVRPWPWADTWPVARLQVPARDIDLFVLAGASGRTLAFGPGWVAGTERLNHDVLGGHRDTHFAFLRHMEPGSRFRLQDRSGAWRDYRVQGHAVLDVRQEVILRPGEGRHLLTLVTCYPFDAVAPGGPLRYAVTAEAMDAAAGETTAGETTAGETTAGETAAGETAAGETAAGETAATDHADFIGGDITTGGIEPGKVPSAHAL